MGKPRRNNNSPRTQHRGGGVTKGERRQSQRDKVSRYAQEHKTSHDTQISNHHIKKVEYYTDRQRLLGTAIRVNTATFATGPAGTGKTHIAIAEMIAWFLSSNKHKFVLTNPATEIGEKLGTLPGDKDDKVAISTRPLRDILEKILGASHVENLVAAGRIMFEPLGSILGMTFDDAMIVLDEAQNTTPAQMKAMLTRVGHRSKIVIAGDYKEQLFIDGPSGLKDAINRIGRKPGVGHVDFTVDDIVRSEFCKNVIQAYREEE